MCQIWFESVQRGLLPTYVKCKLVWLLYLTLYFFTRMATDRTGQPIFTLNGSKDAIWRTVVPFGGLIDELNFHGGVDPGKPLKGDRE